MEYSLKDVTKKLGKKTKAELLQIITDERNQAENRINALGAATAAAHKRSKDLMEEEYKKWYESMNGQFTARLIREMIESGLFSPTQSNKPAENIEDHEENI